MALAYFWRKSLITCTGSSRSSWFVCPAVVKVVDVHFWLRNKLTFFFLRQLQVGPFDGAWIPIPQEHEFAKFSRGSVPCNGFPSDRHYFSRLNCRSCQIFCASSILSFFPRLRVHPRIMNALSLLVWKREITWGRWCDLAITRPNTVVDLSNQTRAKQQNSSSVPKTADVEFHQPRVKAYYWLCQLPDTRIVVSCLWYRCTSVGPNEIMHTCNLLISIFTPELEWMVNYTDCFYSFPHRRLKVTHKCNRGARLGLLKLCNALHVLMFNKYSNRCVCSGDVTYLNIYYC